jgi:cytochrome c oxidase subunit 3
MSAVADAHSHDHGDHPPVAHHSSRADSLYLGIYLFLASEAMLFGSFFAAYFFARVNGEHGDTWPPEGYHLPVYLALVNTIILVTSSFTVHWATTSVKKDDRPGVIAGLGLTFMLGFVFIVVQGLEYARLGWAPKDNAFATTFFGLTGLHGLHVFVGLTLLAVAFTRAVRGHYSAQHHHGLEVPAIYWHFVDVMWIVVYVTVYVI